VSSVPETAFEQEIAGWLHAHGGYSVTKLGNQAVVARDFDPALGVDWTELLTFIGATQQDAWNMLVERHGGDQSTAQVKFKNRVAQELDHRGTVDVLRHGVVDMGIEIRTAYFLPASGLNPDLRALYDANRLAVVRQFAYESEGNRTVDLALLVNGLLVATAELKNALTGQTIEHAIAQYRTDRDPTNVALGRRAIVHFALDTERVALTTRLAGTATRFLPFNRGHDRGAGNPPNPDGHRTAYLWREVWQRDAWLDILQRFVHAEADGRNAPDRVIFPRFHQWDAVRRLEADAREHGTGRRYLVQHSAGSGKSNTIAWLAHRLSSLHGADDEAVFDKVIVITDRVVLDKQLQDTIYQFEHTHGVVERIDQDSTQLAEALAGRTARIIITTLQKFPFVLDKIEGLPARRYAVIVDEAHSSQTGDAARDLKLALSGGEAAELDAAEAADADVLSEESSPSEAALQRAVEARGMPANLSFFAFTATPKGKTLQLFGERAGDAYRPFHLYPMRQAIEEGFILDVLANYTTYETLWRIQKAIAEDPKYDTPAARRAIARYVTLHDVNLSQKAAVVAEHFLQHVAHRIGGRAKAMVVTSSRLHAVRFTLALRRHIDENHLTLGVLGAFSGTVVDGGAEWTESKINDLPESRTARALDGDDFQILVVAEKYQTGFDQPKLYAMYVDRALTGLAAVQTLSRLNRTMEGKEGTFVLDFRNETEDIAAAFQPYYTSTSTTATDPNLLYNTRVELDRFGVLRADEVRAMIDLLLAAPTPTTSGRVYAVLTPAVDRWKDLDEDDREAFRDANTRFVRTYAFLSQLVSFGDAGLERDYMFCKALGHLLPVDAMAPPPPIADEIELTHLRIELREDQIGLGLENREGEVDTTIGDGRPPRDPDEELLSRIITTMNERYGLQLTEADRLHFDAVAEDLIADEALQQQAAANSRENFRIPLEKAFTNALVNRLAANRDLTYRVMDSESMLADLLDAYLPVIHGRARVANQEHLPIGELIAMPEGVHLERKSTLRWDLRRAEASKVMETAVLKTVAAFLNSAEGGTLLIGVADDGSVLGLESDYLALRKEGKDDADRFQLALHQAVLNAVGAAAAAGVTSEVHTVAGGDVCRVHVRPSGHPVHATVTTVDAKGQQQKRSRFYVRNGPSTIEITDEDEVQRYIRARWGKTAG